MPCPGRRTPATRRSPGCLGLLALTLASLLLAGCEPLSAAELRREIDSVHSFAAEAAVLADQIRDQRTKRTFARVQARALSDAAEHSAERLTDADPGDGLEQQTADAIDLASQVSTAIGDLETAPDDSDLAAETGTRLRQLAAKAEQLADSL